MNRLFVVWVMVGVMASLSARAEDGLNEAVLGKDLLDCQDTDHLRTHCRLRETTLAPSQCVGEGESLRCFEVALRVDYDFKCEGHPVSVGVASERKSARFHFGKKRHLKLVGHGPFTTKNIDPVVTRRATLDRGCALKITRLSKDLSPATLDQVTDHLTQLRALNAQLTQAKSIESLSTALRGILLQIDINALATLLATLEERVTGLEAAYPEPQAKKALGELADALADSAADVQAGPTEAQLERVSDELKELGALSAKLSENVSTAVARRFVYGMEMLAFGAKKTMNKYGPLFREEDRKARLLMGEEPDSEETEGEAHHG